MTKHKLSSTFALLDVQKGRKQLAEHFAARPHMGACPKELRIHVVIHGYIDHQHGRDDGTSTEFAVTVTKLEVSS